MRFVSTRGAAEPVPFSVAVHKGLAPDGGLYVPDRFPTYGGGARRELEAALDRLNVFAATLLSPFFAGDRLEPHLDEVCAAAFAFDLPLVQVSEDTSLLELFHGPTAAFKDFGARFLAAALDHGNAATRTGAHSGAASEDERPLTILVATSGDTGAAVAAAFHRRPGITVGVLYPKGGVSTRQERQLTCWDENVTTFAVRGSFDDCQRMVKDAFTKGATRAPTIRPRLTTANSINIGRLLPQVVYYAWAAVAHRAATGRVPGFVVPSGNVGNAVGALWARRLGFPIRHVVLATNENRAVPDWFATGEWRPRPAVRTLANAMDVGDPSNMERVVQLHPDREALLAQASAVSVDDEGIRQAIEGAANRWGRIVCPHTAAAMHARERFASDDWIVVATAHPAKFPEVVEPLVGGPVPVPPRLQMLLDRPTQVTEIAPDADVLTALGSESG